MPSADASPTPAAASAPGSATLWGALSPFPRRRDWLALRREFEDRIASTFPDWIAPDQPHFRDQRAFAVGRFDEGANLARYFLETPPASARDGRLDVLDLGAGNGGVALALANCPGHRVRALDVVPDHNLIRLRRSIGLPVDAVVGEGGALPYASESFDAVLLLDVLEHAASARRLGREVMRVLRPGGVCMITTPPRLRYVFARDPHWGIPALTLLPNFVQRLIVNRLARRRILGHAGSAADAFDVAHIYWHVAEIARLFPEPRRVEALFNRMLDPSSPSRRERWHYRFRNFFWDRILIYKI